MDFLLDGQQTERLFFRKLKPSDFDVWLPFHKDPRTSEFWGGLPADPEKACLADFNRTFFRYDNKLGGKCALLLKETNELIGLCGLLVQKIDGRQELEIAYSLLPQFWKKGFAIEAAQQCRLVAKTNQLSASLIAIIHIENTPSQQVALKVGMQIDKTTTYNDNPVHIFRLHL
ncbi:MAG: GNAT family N-acetyltransferase [Flavobacteriaceae bacterium]